MGEPLLGDASRAADLLELVGLRTLASVSVAHRIPRATAFIDGRMWQFDEAEGNTLKVTVTTDVLISDKMSAMIPSIVVEFRLRETTCQRVAYAIRESDGLVVFAVGEVWRDGRVAEGWNIEDILHSRPQRAPLIMWSEEGFTPKWLDKETR